jgi:hypothetical protein
MSNSGINFSNNTISEYNDNIDIAMMLNKLHPMDLRNVLHMVIEENKNKPILKQYLSGITSFHKLQNVRELK